MDNRRPVEDEIEHDSIASALADLAAAPMSRKAVMGVARALALAVAGRAIGEAPELALLVSLAAERAGGPQLVLEAVEVAREEYETLSEAEYMVSVYNAGTVPRVMVRMPDGTLRRADAVIAAAHAQFAALSGHEGGS